MRRRDALGIQVLHCCFSIYILTEPVLYPQIIARRVGEPVYAIVQQLVSMVSVHMFYNLCLYIFGTISVYGFLLR